jgi:CheY-like chemotaxis protein
MTPSVLLCIDDQPHRLNFRKSSLEPFGYSVALATNGYAAIKMLEDITVAAVLIEYKSEGIDAETIALHIRQRFPKQPIILLSAYHDLPERILWLVDEYVMRSEPLAGLVQVIERVTRPVTTGEPRKPSGSDNSLKRGREIA